MKKIFTLIGLLCGSIAAMATDYTGTMIVTVNGNVTTPQSTTISVTEDAGSYKLTLQDFCLIQESSNMPVGTINVSNIPFETDDDGEISLETKQSITIEEGSYALPSGSMWMGPLLGEIPISLSATLEDGILGVILDFTFSTFNIQVYFSSGTYQIGNSDFEAFHTATNGSATSDEPNNWHSFMSSTGILAAFVSGTPHTFSSDIVRPGSTGTKSVLVTSTSIIGIIANGTITTGRMNAGDFSATSTKNNAFMDMSLTDTDANGDPFYAALNGEPDSIAVWVKFIQGTPNADHPYATLSATITDGTYYQDPEDKEYTNILAKASNTQIASNGAAWQRISVPFDYNSYISNDVDAKAILVTISTNADPGQGSIDSLYIDDLSLIYNSQLSNIEVFDRSITGFDKDTYTYNVTVAQMPTEDDIDVDAFGKDAVDKVVINGSQAIINVYAGDLQSYHTYTINFTVDGTGISSVESSNNVVKAYYNMNGQQIASPAKGQMYITKYADGKAVKSIKK